MDVEHHQQVILQRLVYSPLHAGQEARFNREGRCRSRVAGPTHRDAHRVEAPLADQEEILRLQGDAPLALGRGFQGIAKVDPAAEPAVLGEGIGRPGYRLGW